MAKLVYIGGYGHSGSTLLEYLMTASPQVIACGEVASSLRERMRKKRCTCSRRVHDCPVWGPFQASSAQSWAWRHEDLTLALLKRVGAAYAVMVDSSKTAWGSAAVPFRLRRKLGRDFRLVHIVRDPRGVCWSLLKKAERNGKRPLAAVRCSWATLGWSVANIACEFFGWKYPDHCLRVRYEDLAYCPREVMTSLFQQLLSDAEWRCDNIGTSDNRHQLYGNRMRSQKLSFVDIKEDAAWRTATPQASRRLIDWFSSALRDRYGYP
jgi:hypothetical protein